MRAFKLLLILVMGFQLSGCLSFLFGPVTPFRQGWFDGCARKTGRAPQVREKYSQAHSQERYDTGWLEGYNHCVFGAKPESETGPRENFLEKINREKKEQDKKCEKSNHRLCR